ncbi:MAG: hypothetical protein JXA57_20970 [Armatimonadetes bacterium]|nr:hypothetical protein [Armatimonadota bacterium]
MRVLAAGNQSEALAVMEPWGVFKSHNLDEAIDVATENGATRATVYLIDSKQRLFGARDGLSL